MSNLKDGKVAISDRDKYRQLSLDTGSVLSVPAVLTKAFEEAGLASKWVSKAKLASNGGFHPNHWIPYQISAAQKAEFPKSYIGNIVTEFLERGDLILAVKPIEMQQKHKAELKRKTEQQLEARFQEVDAKGKPILRPEE